MSRTCESCGELIAFLDAQTTSGNSTWHTRCWNQAAEQRAAYIAECEDSEGFARRPLPDELSKSETGADRSEVFPIMATERHLCRSRSTLETSGVGQRPHE
jgi:hypothetical protein